MSTETLTAHTVQEPQQESIERLKTDFRASLRALEHCTSQQAVSDEEKLTQKQRDLRCRLTRDLSASLKALLEGMIESIQAQGLALQTARERTHDQAGKH